MIKPELTYIEKLILAHILYAEFGSCIESIYHYLDKPLTSETLPHLTLLIYKTSNMEHIMGKLLGGIPKEFALDSLKLAIIDKGLTWGNQC